MLHIGKIQKIFLPLFLTETLHKAKRQFRHPKDQRPAAGGGFAQFPPRHVKIRLPDRSDGILDLLTDLFYLFPQTVGHFIIPLRGQTLPFRLPHFFVKFFVIRNPLQSADILSVRLQRLPVHIRTESLLRQRKGVSVQSQTFLQFLFHIPANHLHPWRFLQFPHRISLVRPAAGTQPLVGPGMAHRNIIEIYDPFFQYVI